MTHDLKKRKTHRKETEERQEHMTEEEQSGLRSRLVCYGIASGKT